MDVEFIYLTQREVLEAGLNMKMAVEICEETCRLHGLGQVVLPHKTVLDLGEKERGRINSLPAYVGGRFDACGIKWIASFPKNPVERGLPRATALLIINDSWSGIPLAVMDGTLISSVRTGAVTGVGVKYLARKDSRVVGIIGTSVIAKTQIEAIKTVLPSIEEVRAYSRTEEKRKRFAEFVTEKFGVKAVAASSAEEAVRDADIIVTATTADAPIVKDAWVKKGSLFVHVGSYQEEEYEVVLNSDKVVVDDWEHVLHRRTPVLAKMYLEGVIDESKIYANLREIVVGAKPGRESDDERIFFAPIGLGIFDVAIGYEIYKSAKEKGLGVKLKLFGGEPLV